MTTATAGGPTDATTFSDADLAVDRSLSAVAASFRFLLDFTPVDLVAARSQFEADGCAPVFRYRPLEDDPGLTLSRLEQVPVDEVEDATLASLLRSKARELQLQLEMLRCRDQPEFSALSIELFGGVSPGLIDEANRILREVDGYIVAQEVLPHADEGDVRMFVMNGEPLRVGDECAVFRRRNSTADGRSNMKVGAKAEAVKVTDEMLDVVAAVRPKLLADGMFLVGLDIVGDKLMEVNVFSPGGLGTVEALYGVPFTDPVIDALEHKVAMLDHYSQGIENSRLATL